MLNIEEVSKLSEIEKLKLRARHIQKHIQELNKAIAEVDFFDNDYLKIAKSLTTAYNSITKTIILLSKENKEEIDLT